MHSFVLALVLAFLHAPLSHAASEEIPIAATGSSTGVRASEISSYPVAIDAIVRVFTQELGLAVPEHTLEIHGDLAEFEAGLIKHLGLKPELARSTAAFAKGAVGGRAVLLYAPRLVDMSWPDRIELLAHELGHTIQLGLTDYRPLNRLQWLTEGFAEWAGYAVTDRLGLDGIDRARARIVAKLRAPGVTLPKLSEMNTFAQWIDSRTKYGFDATFSQSFLAYELILARHSRDKVLEYFRQFQTSSNYPANFRAAFGQTIPAFQKELDAHLERVLKGED